MSLYRVMVPGLALFEMHDGLQIREELIPGGRVSRGASIHAFPFLARTLFPSPVYMDLLHYNLAEGGEPICLASCFLTGHLAYA